MTHYAVRAFGRDRPGVVAALTWAIVEAGGNLQDVSSTSLGGHFAMLLIVDAPEARENLQGRLAETATSLGVGVSVREVDEGGPERKPPTHALSAYGPDRPGIVAGISRILADRAVNITELTCRTVREENREIYWMRAEVTVPAGANLRALEADLAGAADGLGLDITFGPMEGPALDRAT